MIQRHRILTEVGKDKKITLELKQDYDLLEILSLKFSQQQAYTSLCADYGVVCGRISVNNGFGVPNARVSIFVPLDTLDEDDPVISALYPYKQIDDKDENGYRYNLLPSRKQHGGHEPTGTFFDQSDILNEESKLEVFEKYYSFTVKTNDSGDFMIWGVPLGQQTLHVDVDLSDIGCFSLRPDDFIRQGLGVDKFKNSYSFKSSVDISSLPQIVSFTRTIDVYPFWGNIDLCEIGITRTDFDLSDEGVKIEPKAYLLGSIYTDQGDNSVNKNCTPRGDMGNKCSLITESAKIEIIRFTTKKDTNKEPILEIFELEEDIDDDGSFVLTLPMNMDYIFTNEYGENEITNDPNKGIATSSCYRFRISIKNESLGRTRTTASYLIPNIREYSNDIDKSYAWSLSLSDYPTDAKNLILNSVDGKFYPQDYFYRMTYNKVYSVSSFMGSYFSSNGSSRQTFLGIKEIAPKKEDDCESNVVTPPINFGVQKFNFSILLALIVNAFEKLIYTAFVAIIQVLIIPFQFLYNFRLYIRAFGVTLLDWRPFSFFDTLVIEPLQRFGTLRLGISIYPECENCEDVTVDVPTSNSEFDPEQIYGLVASGICRSDQSLYNPEVDVNELILSFTGGTDGLLFYGDGGLTLNDIYNNAILDAGRYYIKNTTNNKSTSLQINTFDYSSTTYYKHDDTNNTNQWVDWITGIPTTGITYEIYDSQTTAIGSSTSTSITESLGSGCQQYVSVYNEDIVYGSYCVSDPSIQYSALTTSDLYAGTYCTIGVNVGQVIRSVDSNPCGTCGTKSGYSEFRYGLFTIVPAASSNNWNVNFSAIAEYARRKLIAKLFCEGVSNYSFIDNWLAGSLYMFPFKAKVRWDDEEALDLNVRRTKYCDSLVYFKVGSTNNIHKRFYYRSAYFNNNNFERPSSRNTLGHPTSIVDLGPRDEFIKEICTDPSLDPNCSVVRNIGPTSYQDFKEMFGLYINYILDILDQNANYRDFFKNKGFNPVLPTKLDGRIMNGDILQLISINSEAGIEGFDLQNKKYVGYNPQVLDVDEYPDLFHLNSSSTEWGPFPLNLMLDGFETTSGSTEGNGYRVRACLNELGRLTETAQEVPFYLWNKNGEGFGYGFNHSWDYQNPINKKLQGMYYGYNYSGNDSHKYILFPMTKEYSGNTIDINGVDLNDVVADVESNNPTGYNNYNSQEEGFTYLYITGGTTDNPTGILYTRTGETGNWAQQTITTNTDFIIKPTTNNYSGNKQILSTPFLFYFGIKPGKTAIDKFIQRFGPSNAFTTVD